MRLSAGSAAPANSRQLSALPRAGRAWTCCYRPGTIGRWPRPSWTSCARSSRHGSAANRNEGRGWQRRQALVRLQATCRRSAASAG